MLMAWSSGFWLGSEGYCLEHVKQWPRDHLEGATTTGKAQGLWEILQETEEEHPGSPFLHTPTPDLLSEFPIGPTWKLEANEPGNCHSQ